MFRFRTPDFSHSSIHLNLRPRILPCFDRQIILAAACTTYRYVVMEDVAEKVESIES